MKCRILASFLLVAFAFSSISSADHPFSQTPLENTQEQSEAKSDEEFWQSCKRAVAIGMVFTVGLVFFIRKDAELRRAAAGYFPEDYPPQSSASASVPASTPACGNAPSKCCCSSNQGE